MSFLDCSLGQRLTKSSITRSKRADCHNWSRRRGTNAHYVVKTQDVRLCPQFRAAQPFTRFTLISKYLESFGIKTVEGLQMLIPHELQFILCSVHNGQKTILAQIRLDRQSQLRFNFYNVRGEYGIREVNNKMFMSCLTVPIGSLEDCLNRLTNQPPMSNDSKYVFI